MNFADWRVRAKRARLAPPGAAAALPVLAGDKSQLNRNSFAPEYPVSRLLCDARILAIFEGAAEIQANVIARRILEG